jgi:uncharacterized protein (TIGR02265 family)
VSLIVDFPQAAAELGLEARLRAVPATAQIRGIMFRLLEDDLARRGFKGWPRWVEILGEQPRSYRLYPVRHLLVAYAEAAALISTDPREGLRELCSAISQPFSESWYGRAWRQFLKPDPFGALQWLERFRDHMCAYGQWRVESLGAGRATLHMMDEYFWIEPFHRGGCEGMLRVCGVEGEVAVELDSLFCGRLQVRWNPVR